MPRGMLAGDSTLPPTIRRSEEEIWLKIHLLLIIVIVIGMIRIIIIIIIIIIVLITLVLIILVLLILVLLIIILFLPFFGIHTPIIPGSAKHLGVLGVVIMASRPPPTTSRRPEVRRWVMMNETWNHSKMNFILKIWCFCMIFPLPLLFSTYYLPSIKHVNTRVHFVLYVYWSLEDMFQKQFSFNGDFRISGSTPNHPNWGLQSLQIDGWWISIPSFMGFPKSFCELFRHKKPNLAFLSDTQSSHRTPREHGEFQSGNRLHFSASSCSLKRHSLEL